MAIVRLDPRSPEFEGQCDVVDALRAAGTSGVIEGGGRALAKLAAETDRVLARALSAPRELLGDGGDPMDAVDIVIGALEEAARGARDQHSHGEFAPR